MRFRSATSAMRRSRCVSGFHEGRTHNGKGSPPMWVLVNLAACSSSGRRPVPTRIEIERPSGTRRQRGRRDQASGVFVREIATSNGGQHTNPRLERAGPTGQPSSWDPLTKSAP